MTKKNKKTLIISIIIVVVVLVFLYLRKFFIVKNSEIHGFAEDKADAEKHAKRFAAFLDLMNVDVSDFGVNDWKKYVEYTKIPMNYLTEFYKLFCRKNWKGTEDEKFKMMLSAYWNVVGLPFR